MLSAFRSLALEVWRLPVARDFYQDQVSLPLLRETETEAVFDIGASQELILRRPGTVPRGGLHVHYAFRTSTERYQDWLSRLDSLDPEEHQFGDARSLYVYDPDDHCVEIAGDPHAPESVPLSGMFEVVLEVESLPDARAFYTDLGFEVVDEGADRERCRLEGPVALELWTPQLGLADARGGVHCDLEFTAHDPAAVHETVRNRVSKVQDHGEGVRFRDPDGHYLTIHPANGS